MIISHCIEDTLDRYQTTMRIIWQSSSELQDVLLGMQTSDVYDYPNMFKVLENNAGDTSYQTWRVILNHPFTPTYVKLNLHSYILAVRAAINNYKDGTVVEELLNFTYKQLLYNKNKKKSYILAAEHLLPIIIEHRSKILHEILLNKDNLALLEANLIANMQNYTNTLVTALTKLNIVHAAQFYEILYTKVKSRHRNRLLLKLYLKINSDDVIRNTEILDLIIKYKLFQIKEDSEHGNTVTRHLTALLSSLQYDDYCSIACRVLPLSYTIVSLEKACCYNNDALLSQLFVCYHKLGRLVELFRELFTFCFMHSMCLEEKSRASLIEVSRKLTEVQVVDLTHLICEALNADNNVQSPKRMKRDPGPHCFVTDCCYVLLSSCQLDLSENEAYLSYMDILLKVTDKIPAPSRDALKLYFSEAVGAECLPVKFTINDKLSQIESEGQLQLFLHNLQYSNCITDDVDLLLSRLSAYPYIILANIGRFYDYLLTDHHILIAQHILSTPSSLVYCEMFSRLTDLHSVIVVCILKRLQLGYIKAGYLADPLIDINISAAREIIKLELNVKIIVKEGEYDNLLEVISQLSMYSCYLRLLVTSWILCRRSPSKAAILTRFCRPPDPLPSLAVVHGAHAGMALAELLPRSKEVATTALIETYLRACILITSVDLTAFLLSLTGEHCEVIGVVVKVLQDKPGCLERYKDQLAQLNNSLFKFLENIPRDAGQETRCLLYCASRNICSLIQDQRTFFHSEEIAKLMEHPDVPIAIKLELCQVFIENETVTSKITHLSHIIMKVLDEDDDLDQYSLNFKSSNKILINHLFKNLPRKSAEFLLNNISFSCDMLEDIWSVSNIPLSLVPKLISYLDRKQVLMSIKGGKDVQLLSQCLLCLIQHSYPLHVLNSIFDNLLCKLANKEYLSQQDVIANIVRSCELIAKQADVARHHSPYILQTIFEYISRGNSVLVNDVTPAVYPLFSVCKVQGFQFLQARLSPGAKLLFVDIYEHFKQNVKYQGKI